jgi:hypothetical protein
VGVSAEKTSLIGEQYAALATELDVAPPRADTASAVGALRAYLRGKKISNRGDTKA